MDEASVALKLEGADVGGMAAVEAAGVAVEMEIAFTYIGVTTRFVCTRCANRV
jgi:hypothetical protein